MAVAIPANSNRTAAGPTLGLGQAEWVRGKIPSAVQRLRTVVLLGGSVHRTPFLDAIGRPTAMLPFDDSLRIIDRWADALEHVRAACSLETIQCRVVLDRAADMMANLPASDGIEFKVETDPGAFRGTGGLLADLAAELNPEDFMLVAPAATVPPPALVESLQAAARIGTDVTIFMGCCGRPLDLFMIRCGALRGIPSIGYIDFKEQAIPLIAKSASVGVARTGDALQPSARTASAYLDLLRALHGDESLLPTPFAERWAKKFAVIEKGAEVAYSACLHDAVVLAGASVQAGAKVARSIVCPGARIASGAVVVGKIVTADSSYGVGTK